MALARLTEVRKKEEEPQDTRFTIPIPKNKKLKKKELGTRLRGH